MYEDPISLRPDLGMTVDRYRCRECGHRGEAEIVSVIEDRHPYGDGYATEILIDRIECGRCGGSKLAEIEG